MFASLRRWLNRAPKADRPKGRYRPRLEALEERTLLSTYDVGPGMAYTTLSSVPWANLAPGDTVNIHWQPQGYHEKILLSASGTADAPIRIVGIAGPNGQLPVIDGQNATTAGPDLFRYSGTEPRGLITVSLNSQQPWGYEPSYIQIQGLEIRDANPSYSFTDGHGTVRQFSGNAAGLYVERGEHITVTGCVIDNNANGLFVSSGGDSATTSVDLLVQNNYIYGNGVAGTDQEHNVYTEADGIVFQYNHFGPLTAGALGNNLKDRSAGTIVRYNWFDGVPGHLLDLVNAQDGVPLLTGLPSYNQTYVYGNTFVNGPHDSSLIIHYGGDDGMYANYRNGTLYFYNNTIINEADQLAGAGNRWRTIVFQLDTNSQSLDARNNIFYNAPVTPGATPSEFSLLQFAGNAFFGNNWVSPTWLASSSAGSFTGAVSGTNNFFVDPTNNPGFVNLAADDLRLAPGSNAIGKAGLLPPGVYPVDEQYAGSDSGTAIAAVGLGSDFGAFQSGSGSGTPAPTVTPTNDPPPSGNTNSGGSTTPTTDPAPVTDPSPGSSSGGATSPAPIATAPAGAIRVAAADAGGAPEVKVYDVATGQLKFDFLAYAANFTGGVRVAVGDVNGDGTPDIITAAGPGGSPDIHVYDGNTGNLMMQFFAFSPNFTGGVYVAAGDVNGDGHADIICGADQGGGPNVTVISGMDGSVLQNFFAYDPRFTGGVRVAAGDINGDGHADVICGAGSGGGPNVTVISGATGALLDSFFAFSPGFSAGIYVAAGDVNGDGQTDIVVGAGAGGGPNVTAFDPRTGAEIANFFAFDSKFTGGVRVAANDGQIVAVAGPGGGPAVNVSQGATGAAVDQFFAFDPRFSGGLYVAG